MTYLDRAEAICSLEAPHRAASGMVFIDPAERSRIWGSIIPVLKKSRKTLEAVNSDFDRQ